MSERELTNIQTGLPLDSACSIIDAALAAGREAGLLPLTVAVLDADQELLLAELAQALELQNEARQAVALNLLGGASFLDRFRDRLRRRRGHRRHHDAPETDASL